MLADFLALLTRCGVVYSIAEAKPSDKWQGIYRVRANFDKTRRYDVALYFDGTGRLVHTEVLP